MLPDACCGGEVVQAGRASYCYRTSGGTRDEAKGVCADMGVGVMLPEPTSATGIASMNDSFCDRRIVLCACYSLKFLHNNHF